MNKRKKTKDEKEMINILRSSAHTIQSISDNNTKSLLDLNRGNQAYFEKESWQKELIAEYNFFVTMIGLVEALIINETKLITNELSSGLDNELDELHRLINKRNNIVGRYREYKSDFDLPIINKVLNGTFGAFVYNGLEKIYADLEINNYNYQLHQSFIQAYNNGSRLAYNCNLKLIVLTYKKLLLNIIKTKIKNEQRIEKTGNAKNLVKIIEYNNNRK